MNYGFKYCCRVRVWSADTYCSSVHNVHNVMTLTELIHTVKCASICISSLISSIGQPFWSLSVSSHLCLASATHHRSAPHYGACHWEWPEILLHVWKMRQSEPEIRTFQPSLLVLRFLPSLRRILPCCMWRKVFHSDHADTIWLF